MSEVNMEMAKTVYESICAVLDKMELNYKRIDEDLVVLFGHRGDDMNHDLIMMVNGRREVIQLIETLPFSIDPEKSRDVASAVCYVNSVLLLGGFTYDMEDTLRFEMVQSYAGSLIGEETIKRMILLLANSVEEYDDKFLALNKGYLKPEDFKETE